MRRRCVSDVPEHWKQGVARMHKTRANLDIPLAAPGGAGDCRPGGARRRGRSSAGLRPPPRTIDCRVAQPPRVSVGQVATAAAGECLPGVDRRRGRLVATAAAGNCRPNNDLSRGRSSAGRQPLLPAIVGQVATAAAGEFRPVQGATPRPDLHPGLPVLPLVSCRSGPGVSRRGLQADTQKKEDVVRRSMIGPWPPQGVSRRGMGVGRGTQECSEALPGG